MLSFIWDKIAFGMFNTFLEIFRVPRPLPKLFPFYIAYYT